MGTLSVHKSALTTPWLPKLSLLKLQEELEAESRIPLNQFRFTECGLSSYGPPLNGRLLTTGHSSCKDTPQIDLRDRHTCAHMRNAV